MVCTLYPSEKGEHRELRRLVARNFPVVTFDGAALLDLDSDDISPDFGELGRLQVAHALEVGKRRILIVAPQPAAKINRLRDAAITQFLAENGAQAPLVCRFEQPVDCETPSSETVQGPLHSYIEANIGAFDAIISYDSICSLACRSLLACGQRVPEDVAVIGTGNGLLASYGMVPITSVDTSDEQVGRQAFDLLRKRIESPGTAFKPRRIIVEPTLVPRQSTVGVG